MRLDCIRASDVGLVGGWVVINTVNGGIVAHNTSDDNGFAWMQAAQAMAEALDEITRTIHAISPQRMNGDSGRHASFQGVAGSLRE